MKLYFLASKNIRKGLLLGNPPVPSDWNVTYETLEQAEEALKKRKQETGDDLWAIYQADFPLKSSHNISKN
jgi:hypothetical protein